MFQYVSSCSWTFEETVRTGDTIANTWLIGHRQTHHLLCSTVHLFYSCKREKIGAINFKEIFSKRYTHHNDETQAWTCSARFKKKTRVSQAQNERRVAHPSMVLLAHYIHNAQSSMMEPDSESGKYIIRLHCVEYERKPWQLQGQQSWKLLLWRKEICTPSDVWIMTHYLRKYLDSLHNSVPFDSISK